jgi:hypothetical protein
MKNVKARTVAFSGLRQGFAKTGTGDFQAMYRGNKLTEAGSPMGAVSVGPADLLMLKLVSSKRRFRPS